jgi:hypothetical protein
MRRHWRVFLTAGAALAVISAEALAWDKEEYCRNYAGMATGSARENIRLHCGFGGLRYTTDWRDHFGWCMSVDRAAAEREHEIRRHDMIACNRH